LRNYPSVSEKSVNRNELPCDKDDGKRLGELCISRSSGLNRVREVFFPYTVTMPLKTNPQHSSSTGILTQQAK
jgi:hypothetical protein